MRLLDRLAHWAIPDEALALGPFTFVEITTNPYIPPGTVYLFDPEVIPLHRTYGAAHGGYMRFPG